MKNKKMVLKLGDPNFADILLKEREKAAKENAAAAKARDNSGNGTKSPLEIKKLAEIINEVKVNKPVLVSVDGNRIEQYKQENKEIRDLGISGGLKLFQLREEKEELGIVISKIRPFAEKEEINGPAKQDLTKYQAQLSEVIASEKKLLAAGDDSFRGLLEFDYVLEIIRHADPDIKSLREKMRILCYKGYCKSATPQEIEKHSKDRKWPEHTAFLARDLVYFMGPLTNTDGRKKALQTTLRKKFEEAQVMKAKELQTRINRDLSGFAKCVPGLYLFETKEHYDKRGKKHNPGFLVVELYDHNKKMKKTEEPFFVVKPVDGVWSLEWAVGKNYIPWFWLKEREVIISEEKKKNYSAETLEYFDHIVSKLCILYEIWDRGLNPEVIKRDPKPTSVEAPSIKALSAPEIQLVI